MNKICKICLRYKYALRCQLKGCKDDLCEDCIKFVNIVVSPGSECTTVHILAMCSVHASLATKFIENIPDIKRLENITSWLKNNINPINLYRLMRFINTASKSMSFVN